MISKLNCQFTMLAAANAYLYMDMSEIGDYVIQSGDYVEYDIYHVDSSAQISFDFTCTGPLGNLRDASFDQLGLSAHPATNLDAYAYQKWYSRKILIPPTLVGGTIINYNIACEQNIAGTYSTYIRNLRITDGAGKVRKIIWAQGEAPKTTMHLQAPAGNTLSLIVSGRGASAYAVETAKRIKSPNYFVKVTNWNGNDMYFAFKPVKGATRPYINGLGNIKAISQKITPERGRASIGSIGFSLQDKGDRITALVANAVKNKPVVLYGGYDGIDESEYIPLATNRVDGFDIGESMIEYMFKTADIQRSIKKDIFKPKETTLTAQLNAAATTATVADTASFLTVVHPKLGTCGYIRIDDEIIKWTAKTATTFTIARGQFSTTDVQHSVNADVKELIVFEEHPIAVALKVLTSTGAGTNGTYDTLPSHWSLGIDTTLVAIATWESDAEAWLYFNKTDFTSGYQFRFIYGAKVDGKRFVEDEILKVLNAYAPVSVTGALSFKAFAPPVPYASIEQLDEKVLKVKSVGGGHASVINIALFEYDHDLVQNKYMKNIEYLDSQSISDHGESPRHEIKSRGLRSDLNGDAIVLERWNRIKQRFKNPVPIIKTQAFFSKHLIEVGELVDFSYLTMPDIEAGSRGMLNKVAEITNKSFDMAGGALHFDMMLTAFGLSYGLWAPDTVPSYDSATAEEKKRYLFFCDDAGKLGAANDEPKVYA